MTNPSLSTVRLLAVLAGALPGVLLAQSQFVSSTGTEGFPVTGASSVEIRPDGSAVITLDPTYVSLDEMHLVNAPFTGEPQQSIQQVIRADRPYSLGVDGAGRRMLALDAGLTWSGHEALNHVTTTFGSQTVTIGASTALGSLLEIDRHATWVGHMMGGRTNAARPDAPLQQGVAHGAQLDSASVAAIFSGARYALSFSTFTTPTIEIFRTVGASGNYAAVNSSWGGGGTQATVTATSTRAIGVDAVARQFPTTAYVFSAGNTGPLSNTVGDPASGYNGITVGATTPSIGTGLYTTMASFSSSGPQDYSDPSRPQLVRGVRTVVDIVAPGTNLYGAYYGGTTGGNGTTATTGLGTGPTGGANGPAGGPTFYSGSPARPGTTSAGGAIAGTSFAAPIVAGGITLLHDLSFDAGLAATSRDTRVMKALVMNSAAKLPGWNNGQTVVGGVIRTDQGLDWTQGAGQLDLDSAVNHLTLGTTDVAGLGGGTIGILGWDYGELSLGNANTYRFQNPVLAGSPVVATLTWFRNRTYSAFDDATDTGGVVSDLGFANFNLEIWLVDTGQLVAISETAFSESEHLSFTAQVTGTYEIIVRYASQTFGTAVTEGYGLAWSVPEPRVYALLAGVAALALAIVRRRRR